MKRYCPFCRTKKKMVRAGFNYTSTGKIQRWQCTNKRCRRISVRPLKEK